MYRMLSYCLNKTIATRPVVVQAIWQVGEALMSCVKESALSPSNQAAMRAQSQARRRTSSLDRLDWSRLDCLRIRRSVRHSMKTVASLAKSLPRQTITAPHNISTLARQTCNSEAATDSGSRRAKFHKRKKISPSIACTRSRMIDLYSA